MHDKPISRQARHQQRVKLGIPAPPRTGPSTPRPWDRDLATLNNTEIAAANGVSRDTVRRRRLYLAAHPQEST